MADALALSRLLQLASPLLPVGAYCYSQGLEWAIESGEVKDLATAQAWIGDSLQVYHARFELPVLFRLYQAWQAGDLAQVHEWDNFYQAGRDTAEGWAETRQMGYSLRRLLNELKDIPAELVTQLNQLDAPAFPTLYAAIAQHWQIARLRLGLARKPGQRRHESGAARPSGRANYPARARRPVTHRDSSSDGAAGR